MLDNSQKRKKPAKPKQHKAARLNSFREDPSRPYLSLIFLTMSPSIGPFLFMGWLLVRTAHSTKFLPIRPLFLSALLIKTINIFLSILLQTLIRSHLKHLHCIFHFSSFSSCFLHNSSLLLFFNVSFFFSLKIVWLTLKPFNHARISWYCHNNSDVHTHHNMYHWKLFGLCHRKEKSGNEVQGHVNTELNNIADKIHSDTSPKYLKTCQIIFSQPGSGWNHPKGSLAKKQSW